MKRLKLSECKTLVDQLQLYARLKYEYKADGIEPILAKAERELTACLRKLKRLPVSEALARQEPNGLNSIQALRPAGPRRIWRAVNPVQYQARLEGALLARMAGCTLGAPVEGSPIEKMKALADENGDDFPPTDYWRAVPDPKATRYGKSRREEYTREKMHGVPVDDDVAYTLLGLLIAEDYGPDFSTEDVGKAWLKYLPMACTAERVALHNLKQGIPAKRAGVIDNPYCEWIGADIRSDPWGYMAPGWPERAAIMAYRDAFLSHRRQGIYGEMYFSAAMAAAFAVRDPVEALEIGLTEIPRQCAMAQTVRWALALAPRIRNYKAARAAVDKRFQGMHAVHTLNNACLTIWGITIGGTDVTRVLGETVAMGLDNDCTAATAGSIVGAVVGSQGIPKRWTRRFNDTVHSYLIGKPRFSIRGLVSRFTRVAQAVHQA